MGSGNYNCVRADAFPKWGTFKCPDYGMICEECDHDEYRTWPGQFKFIEKDQAYKRKKKMSKLLDEPVKETGLFDDDFVGLV